MIKKLINLTIEINGLNKGNFIEYKQCINQKSVMTFSVGLIFS